MTAWTAETRIEALLRMLVREVVHPAIEREKQAQAAQTSVLARGVQPGPTPVAPTKLSSAKTSSAVKGYRVTDGSGRKGTVTGHEGSLSKVQWDDGEIGTSPATSLKDLQEGAESDDPIGHAQRLIAAYRASRGGYVTVNELRRASGLSLKQFEAGLTVLMGPRGKKARWVVYTELPQPKSGVVMTPSGARVGLIMLQKT